MRAKLLKLVRHLNKDKKLKRGVKDVVKSIKKGARGLCVIAADVSPVDVISHIPILCEDLEIPYIFVRSRLELGIAAETKKPTSVVLLEKPKGADLLEKYEKLFEKIKGNHPYMWFLYQYMWF